MPINVMIESVNIASGVARELGGSQAGMTGWSTLTVIVMSAVPLEAGP